MHMSLHASPKTHAHAWAKYIYVFFSLCFSEDPSSISSELMAISETFNTASFHWDLVRTLGIVCRFQKGNSQHITAGKLLAHCNNQITAFRESVGLRICIFKIGVTCNPLDRFRAYLELGYQSMWVLTSSHSVDQIHMLEAACISTFSQHVGCKNAAQSGGEGALNRSGVAPPFFLYVCGGRADQGRWVG